VGQKFEQITTANKNPTQKYLRKEKRETVLMEGT
jgi:hypothetical protein